MNFILHPDLKKANMLFEKGLSQEAFDILNSYECDNPDDPNLYMRRAYFYAMNKEKNKAIAEVSRAIDLGREEPSDYLFRGNEYQSIKEHLMAIKDYNKIIFSLICIFSICQFLI